MASNAEAELSHLTLEETRAKWAGFASTFYILETITVPLSVTLASQALGTAHGIADAPGVLLEVGCGCGGGAAATCGRLARLGFDETHFYVTDLTQEMVDCAKDTTAGLRDDDHITFQTENSEALSFGDATVDSYYSSLCLQLTPDPDAMLDEAFRVLTPGGRIAVSVWGREELSTQFTIIDEAREHVGLPAPPARRTNYHLGDKESTIAMLRRHGFEGVRAWYCPCVTVAATGQEFFETFMAGSTSMQKMVAGMADETRAAFVAEVVRLADAVLDAGDVIQLDALCVVGFKPVESTETV